jgi:hypothetical protein
MSTIEELREETERLYNEHNEAFQAWMDAEIALKDAIEEELELERRMGRARKYAFLTFAGLIGAAILSNVWIQ